MTAPLTHNAAIKLNLAHMGTTLAEWRACEFTMVQSDGKVCPQVSYPTSYKTAPTLYPQPAGGEWGCCELCGHLIKNFYGIENETRKWTMVVGSECILQFGTVSGVDLARQEVDRYALKFANYLHTLHDELRARKSGEYWRQSVMSNIRVLLFRLDDRIWVGSDQPLLPLNPQHRPSVWLNRNKDKAKSLTGMIKRRLSLEVTVWEWPAEKPKESTSVADLTSAPAVAA